MLLALALACSPAQDATFAGFGLFWNDDSGTLEVSRNGEQLLDLRDVAFGNGSADISFASGSYLFENEQTDWMVADGFETETRHGDAAVLLTVLRDDRVIGGLQASLLDTDLLVLELATDDAELDRARARFACTGADHFLGAGEQAFDVDHTREAFSLWVSEPGVGKTDSDEPTADWFLTGTRHASSHPVPFLLRPDQPMGLDIATWARVDLDLCASDPDTWSVTTWDARLTMVVVGGDTPLDVVELHTLLTGTPKTPPDWAFAPWNDAVGGPERIDEVVSALRSSGAPSSVIWTEDWRGGEELPVGYHPKLEWEVDRTLYTDPEGTDAWLESHGIKWFGYFSPFLAPDTAAWEEAGDYAIRQPDSDEPYTFTNATLRDVSVLDVTDEDAQNWAITKMLAAAAIGFDGWMADYGEWMPPDAPLANGDALDNHNVVPALWHSINAAAIDAAAAEGREITTFGRSGWWGTQADQPVHWAGDQRTSFDADDGLPTVVPMGIGAGISGVTLFTHDIAGYQSVGNDPSDMELWFRWCELGAFTPVMRTHHGAFKDDNWQFDSDADTLAHWARYADEHTSLFPYLRGLAAHAEQTGRPLVLHPALVYPPESSPNVSWDAIDAWMLGSALYIAPILERDARSREVALPSGADWYDWWTGEQVTAGSFDAELDEIPVFAAGGSIVPTFAEAPDTLVRFESGAEREAGLTDLADADAARIVRVFGSGGRFVEADTTTYTASGTASAAGEATKTLTSGTITVNGLSVEIAGEIERVYTVVVVP